MSGFTSRFAAAFDALRGKVSRTEELEFELEAAVASTLR